MRIAVSGKGGTGKTTVAGLLSRHYGRAGQPVLTLDADSNPNLAISLGLSRKVSNDVRTVANNVRPSAEAEAGRAFCIQHSLNLIVTLPFDEGLLAAEANGTAIIDAYPDSPLVQATATLATTLEETLNGNRR